MAIRILVFNLIIIFPFLALSQKSDQTITFDALPQKVFGDPSFELTGKASSNLVVFYSSSNVQVAIITGTTVTIVGAGQTTIVAKQAGNDNFNPAPDIARTLIVAKANQIITFPDLNLNLSYGDQPFNLGVVSSSGLPLVFSVNDFQVGSVFNGLFFINGAGECTVTVTQPGNTNYLAAASVTKKLFVRKASQNITFSALPIKTYGDPPFIPVTSVSSFLPITLGTSDPNVAIVQSGKIVIIGAGVVDITADQSGNSNYSPATTITRTLTVKKAPQTLAITSAESATYGIAFLPLTASSTSGLPINSFDSEYDTIASVNGTQLIINGAGTTKITVKHPGSANFFPAQVTKLFVVNKASQTITFSPVSSMNFGSQPQAMTAISTSGLPVSFKSTRKSIASISGNFLFAQGLGTATIIVSQNGNSNYLPAAEVSQSVTITGNPSVYQMFGSTRTGGTGKGTLFKLKSDGSGMGTTFNFPSSANNLPNGGLIKASDNKLYGVIGAAGTPANGVVFSMNTDGTNYTILHNFSNSDGSYPTGNLLEASNGYLYGATMYGGDNVGVIFRLQKDGTNFSVLHKFNSGYNASAGLIQGADGRLYGATLQGGAIGYGTLYSINLDGSGYNEFVSFDGAVIGSTPRGALFQGPDSFLYGVTGGGGTQGKGVLYKVHTNGASFTKLVEFDGIAKGSYGASTPLFGSDGKLYAMTQRGGANDHGIIFSVGTAGTDFVKLYDFDGANGKYPFGSLIEASNGHLYGVTSEGGSNDKGTAFRIMKSGSNFMKLLDFNGTNGANPQLGPLLEMQTDLFIGMTYRGGASDAGIIFTITSMGIFTLFKDFPQPASLPEAIVANSDFSGIFGLATAGGTYGGGAVFKVKNNGTDYANLAYLQGDFPYPLCLTRSSTDNKLWGVGREGSISFNYFLFKVDEDGSNYQRVIELDDPSIGNDTRSLIDFSDDYIYGVSIYGGINNSGTVFRIKKDGSGLAKVADVPGGAIGSRPFVPAIKHNNGSIYGVANEGGATNDGAVFKVSSDGIYSKVADLKASVTGAYPLRIIELNGGSLCIATFTKLFTVDEDGKNLQTIFEYSSQSNTSGQMMQSAEGYIYVTLGAGGSSGKGSIFRILPDGSNYSLLADFDGSNGSEPNSIRFEKLSQAITLFEDIPQKQFTDPPFLLKATSTSGSLVRFTSSNPSIASVDGFLVTIHKVGTVTISAQVPESGNFLPSSIIEKTFTIVKSDQQFSFADIPAKLFGDEDFRLEASTSSKLPISFSSSDPTVATVSQGIVTVVGSGTTIITASINLNPNFNAVTPIQKMLTVNKANQDILFYPLATRYVDGDVFNLSANVSSGLPITFGSSSPAVASVSGITLTLQSAGETAVFANASGNNNYNDALTISRPLVVKKHDQFIDFKSILDQSVDETSFSIQNAVASSGLPVIITNTSPHISISGNLVSILGAGRVIINATQDGNASFLPAPVVSNTFCINPAKPVLTADSINASKYVLTSSAELGNQWYKDGILMPAESAQTLTATQGGIYTVKLTIEGCSGPLSQPQALIITGIEDPFQELNIYPNPADAKLVVKLPHQNSADIRICSLLGVELKRIESFELTTEIDISNMLRGVYLIEMRIGTSVTFKRFIKN